MKNSMRIYFLSVSMLTAVSGFASTSQESEKQTNASIRSTVQVGATATVFAPLYPILSEAYRKLGHSGAGRFGQAEQAAYMMIIAVSTAILGTTHYVSGQVVDYFNPSETEN